jgi:ABC-type uncharacterized transport system substrate-binding protein
MRRREFIALLGALAASWPLATRAQQPPRIGVLAPYGQNDPDAQARNAAFLQALQELGWTDGHNVRIDYRWGTGDVDLNRRNATDLVALPPDVILAVGTPEFRGTANSDPHSANCVCACPRSSRCRLKSLARPGGNITGFMMSEYSIGAKWLELLKAIAPGVTRAAVLRDTTTSAGIGWWGAIQTASPSFGVELVPVKCAGC